MASRKVIHYPPPKPWKPDIARWLPFLRQENLKVSPPQPKDGWLLYRLDTLEDVPQE